MRLVRWVLDFSLKPGPRLEGHPEAPPWFGWAIAIMGVIGQVGLSWDSYAHFHLPLDTFWTPPHAVIYTAGLIGTGLVGVTALRNMLRGYPLSRSVPDGYELAIVGCVLFPIGGVSDFIWHATLGFERVLPVWSPSHQLLFLGSGLILSGPLRHAWRSQVDRPGWDVIIATAMVFIIVFFPLLYVNPYVDLLATGSNQVGATGTYLQELGTAALLLQAAGYTGFILLLLRRFTLPLGSLTLMLACQGLFVWPLRGQMLPFWVALVAGLLADWLVILLRPSPARPLQFRIFATAFPAILNVTYFGALLLTTGIWWLPHVWVGMLPGTACLGWLLSYLLLPPRSGLTRHVVATTAPAADGAKASPVRVPR